MIYLKQNNINNVVLTLQENSTLWNYSGIQPYYLFQFTSPTTNQQLQFVSDNISPLSARNSYDQFNIIVTGVTSQNFSAGTIFLNPATFWTYKIFEQTSQYNFNTTGVTGMVEYGKILYSASTTDFNYSYMTGNTEYYVFNTYSY